MSQKVKAFQQSEASILRRPIVVVMRICKVVLTFFSEIATTMYQLETEKGVMDTDKLAVLFQEMIQMCLWSATRSVLYPKQSSSSL